MTPKQRDDLAMMAGGKIVYRTPHGVVYVWPDGSETIGEFWLPETSRDDCQPLFAEIVRRGLWDVFIANLLDVRLSRQNGKVCQRIKHEFRRGIYAVLSGFFTLADIVAAFKVTIEEADRKEGE